MKITSALYGSLFSLLLQSKQWANAYRLYKPIIKSALANWESNVITIIEDTTMVYKYCLVRLSIQCRGCAVVLGWPVLEKSRYS